MQSVKPSIYQREFGLQPIINAAGTFSYLGGSLMHPDVVAAWCEAAEQFVDMEALLDRGGERVAAMLNVEAALITGGAASSLLLATAAAVTKTNTRFPHASQRTSGNSRPEVLRQLSHRDLYDRQLEMCNVELIDVDGIEEAQAKITDRTIMMMAYNIYEPESPLNHQQWLNLAKSHGLPTLLDAAADTPPVANLWKFAEMGYDMVAFSGGKAIGGPQGAGLLLGEHRWIARARQNAFPKEGTVGRVSKVSKEDIVALVKALELFVASGDELPNRCQAQLEVIAGALQDVPSLLPQFITPPVANHFPHLQLTWDEASLEISTIELKQALLQGQPPIATDRVYGTGSAGLLISAINLKPGEEQVVADRIRELLIAP